jgi:hypothetical protein
MRLDPARWLLRIMARGHAAREAEAQAARLPAYSAANPRHIDRFARANVRMWDEIEQVNSRAWTKKMAHTARTWVMRLADLLLTDRGVRRVVR